MAMRINVIGYCEGEKKEWNPYSLEYIGSEHEDSVIRSLQNVKCFVAIGDNVIRQQVMVKLIKAGCQLVNAIHPSAVVSTSVGLGVGVMIGACAIVNAQSAIADGVVCNTGSVIEHQCVIGHFVHIAPGATLAGNVTVGELSFVGGNAVVKQGVRVGRRVVIGAGSVVLNDLTDGSIVGGNPAKPL